MSRENTENNRLALYVISCHVDKPITEDIVPSKYDINIQAGAANTEMRTQEINDHDDFAESISDRNERYSEATAMYWIYKNNTSPYVGITHYRRRFALTDEALDNYMDQGIDIITLGNVDLGQSIEEDYRSVLFYEDWKLFMSLIEKYSPEDVEFAKEYFGGKYIHPCNLNIFRKELYEEYGAWAFPIMDEFYKLSPRKTDRYQRRDVGFIAERLSSLFVEKKRRQGFKIVEVPLNEVGSKRWNPYDECNMDDAKAVFEACFRMYSMDKITEAKNIIGKAINHEAGKSEKIVQLSQLFITAEYERLTLKRTMYEYLPNQWKTDLSTLLESYNAVGEIIRALAMEPRKDIVDLFNNYLRATHFSGMVIHQWCQDLGIEDDSIAQYIQ